MLRAGHSRQSYRNAKIHRALLAAALLQIIAGGNLCHRNLTDIVLDPVEEIHHGKTVLAVRFFRTGDLCLIFDSLADRRGIQMIDDILCVLQTGDQCVVRLVFIQQNLVTGCHLCRCLIELAVGLYLYADSFQIGENLRRQSFFEGEENCAFLRDNKERVENRIVIHIAAAQVQNPGDIVEAGNQVDIRAMLLHIAADRSQLVRRRTDRYISLPE